LNFLLQASPETIRAWFESVEHDDIDYAWSLLEAHSRELDIAAAHFRVEADMEMLASAGKRPYAEANQVLSKFRLKSST
jgi:hypothetical protein